MTDAPVYVFTGHGYEDLSLAFKDRKPMPKGYTLVTFTECGRKTNYTSILPTLGEMSKKEQLAMFQDPTSNQKAIEAKLGATIKVYEPEEDFYPPLYYMPIGDHPTPNGNATFYSKSGLYKLPLAPLTSHLEEWSASQSDVPSEDIEFLKSGYLAKGTLPCEDKPSDDQVKEHWPSVLGSFNGAVFPKEDELRDILAGNVANGFKIEEVFTRMGPGVYYWPICRGDINDLSPNERGKVCINRVMSANYKQAQATLKKQGGGKGRRRKTRRRRAKKTRRH